jgi:hypothetical protein
MELLAGLVGQEPGEAAALPAGGVEVEERVEEIVEGLRRWYFDAHLAELFQRAPVVAELISKVRRGQTREVGREPATDTP